MIKTKADYSNALICFPENKIPRIGSERCGGFQNVRFYLYLTVFTFDHLL